jgi:Kef-type K+ transport system membrane component KefB
MAMGGTVASLAKHHNRPFHAIEGIDWPFMILFFVLAGASLEIEAIYDVGAVTVIYVLSRCIGIYIGTRLGCQITGASLPLRKWLGVALFPQAGVAIGMALLASQRFPDFASIILPVVLTSTIFLEIVAPVITRQALRAAGAIDVAKIRI